MYDKLLGAVRPGGRAFRLGALLLACVMMQAGSSAQAAFLAPGDIVVTTASAVLRVDPITGDRTEVSGSGRGSGPALTGANSITQAVDGSLLVLDMQSTRVVRVDTKTGDRAVVSQVPLVVSDTTIVGEGPYFYTPYVTLGELGPTRIGKTLVTSSGSALVAGGNALFEVDQVTGDRTLLSGPELGAGPMFGSMYWGMVEGADGGIYLSDFYSASIFRIDRMTGNREVVVQFSGEGPQSSYAVLGLASDADGSLLVTVLGPPGNPAVGIFRVDPVTGDNVLVPGSDGFEAFQLAMLPSGKLAHLSAFEGAIHAFDLTTGANIIVSGSGVGSGPSLGFTTGMLVYVPEPSSWALAGLGAMLAGLIAVRRSRRA